MFWDSFHKIGHRANEQPFDEIQEDIIQWFWSKVSECSQRKKLIDHIDNL